MKINKQINNTSSFFSSYLESFDSLGATVVELSSLTNGQTTTAQHQDFRDLSRTHLMSSIKHGMRALTVVTPVGHIFFRTLAVNSFLSFLTLLMRVNQRCFRSPFSVLKCP